MAETRTVRCMTRLSQPGTSARVSNVSVALQMNDESTIADNQDLRRHSSWVQPGKLMTLQQTSPSSSIRCAAQTRW